jgi:type II secretory ATPase GspE/PulE/Tfp pilus assembly ATPase PilB-like protein
VDEEIGDLIDQGVPVREIREAARARGVESVREDGVRKVLAGETSVAELARVVA